jgi:protein-L-isoaspartate(D-aspartate) O-methyltransferase
LFNGAPALLARLIDLLALRPGSRVLHVGAGTGYYSALMAHVVGASGSVLALEVDEPLALWRARISPPCRRCALNAPTGVLPQAPSTRARQCRRHASAGGVARRPDGRGAG